MLEEGKEEFWDAMSNSESGAGSRPVSLRPGSTIYGSILYNSWRMSRPISVISTTSFDERQRNRQSRPISMQLEHPISRYYPVFTIAITVAICTSPRPHCLPPPRLCLIGCLSVARAVVHPRHRLVGRAVAVLARLAHARVAAQRAVVVLHRRALPQLHRRAFQGLAAAEHAARAL